MAHRLCAVPKAVPFLCSVAAAAKRQAEVWFKKQLVTFGIPSSEEAGAGWPGCLWCLSVRSVALLVPTWLVGACVPLAFVLPLSSSSLAQRCRWCGKELWQYYVGMVKGYVINMGEFVAGWGRGVP